MIYLTATKNNLTAKNRELLTSGSSQVNTVQFEFSSDWGGLTRTAVFQCANSSVSMALDGSNTCTIPWETLAYPNREMRVGVYGVDGDAVVLPTIWASLGTVREGTKLGADAKEPTPDLYDQLIAQMGEGRDAAQAAADRAKADAETAATLAAEVTSLTQKASQDAESAQAAEKATQNAQAEAERAQQAAKEAQAAAEAARASSEGDAARANSSALQAQQAAQAAAEALENVRANYADAKALYANMGDLYADFTDAAKSMVTAATGQADRAEDEADKAGQYAAAAQTAQTAAQTAQTTAEENAKTALAGAERAEAAKADAEKAQTSAQAAQSKAEAAADTAAEAAGDAQGTVDLIVNAIDPLAQEATQQEVLASAQKISALLEEMGDKSSDSLNGFGMELGANNEVILTYSDPVTGKKLAETTLPTGDTQTAMLEPLRKIADNITREAELWN